MLLPQPDSPTRPKIVPCWTRNVTSLTADTQPSAVLNLTEIFSSSRAGADPPGADRRAQTRRARSPGQPALLAQTSLQPSAGQVEGKDGEG